MLPTFLGIGVSRSGTTWLHQLLEGHPEVYVPRRKEVAFFSKYYNRGLQWYEGFFPSEREARRYKAVGEITPIYWLHPDCPGRIAKVPSITKLIMIVRNPVDRAYSDYGLRVKNGAWSGSFEEFLSFRPQAIEWGFYVPKLKDYLRYFDREQILVLIYEHTMADVDRAQGVLAEFLGVTADGFPATAAARRVNRSYVPRHRSAYALAASLARKLRYDWDLDWVVNLAKRLGIERLLGEARPLPPMKKETRQHLQQIYAAETEALESLLGVDLACWRQDTGSCQSGLQ